MSDYNCPTTPAGVFNTGICALASTPMVAVDSSQITNSIQNRTQWFYVSTFQAPYYSTLAAGQPTNNLRLFQYISQTDRIQAKIARLSQGQC